MLYFAVVVSFNESLSDLHFSLPSFPFLLKCQLVSSPGRGQEMVHPLPAASERVYDRRILPGINKSASSFLIARAAAALGLVVWPRRSWPRDYEESPGG